MKLPDFQYAAPLSLDEAVSMLAAASGEAQILAGGQSLLPVMAFRLAAPRLLVDLRRIPGLRDITIDGEGVRLGAMVRWREILDHPALPSAFPLLPLAIDHVAHYQIRNRGTVGGSLGHADPAAEFPGIAVLCDGMVEVVGKRGKREVTAADLVVGPLETSLSSDDVIVAVRFPVWSPGRRYGFEEFSRRRGDFAIAGVGVHYAVGPDGVVRDAHVAVIGATQRPCRVAAAEAILNGSALDDVSVATAGAAAAQAVDPPADLHGSVAYRRSLVATLLARALRNSQS